MKRIVFLLVLLIGLFCTSIIQAQIYVDVDTAVVLAVNKHPIQTSDGTIDEGVTYDEAGMDLVWHFTPTSGTLTSTDVVLTTADDQDWAHTKGGVYTCEIPISGESINNTLEGSGYFTGNCTATLPWSSYVYIFRSAAKNDLEVDVATSATNETIVWVTDFATNYDTTLNMWSVEIEAISDDNTTDDDLEDICENSFDLTNDGVNVYTVRDSAPITVANIWAQAFSDLAAGAPSATASVLTGLNWMYQAWRNVTVTVSTGNTAEVRLYKDDGSTIATERDVTVSGNTTTAGEYGAED